VHRLTRHLRGLLVALATLALSAGVVFAAQPMGAQPASESADGLAPASETTQTGADEDEDAPDVDEDEDGDEDEDAPDADEDEDADEDGDADEDEDVDEDEGVGGAPSESAGERAQNHGWFVSQAAKGATPLSSESHGKYVSEIAHSDAGKATATTTKATKATKTATKTAKH